MKWLPESHPQLLELVGLAQECLTSRITGETELSALQLIPLALKAFYEGDLDKAENDLFTAAQQPEAFTKACIKLNYISTQLRRTGNYTRALSIYEKLLKLNPPFEGVILFNQAIAHQSKVLQDNPETFLERNTQESVSLRLALEALFKEPTLPYDDNFYKNKVLHPILHRAVQLFYTVCQNNDHCEEDYAQSCREARDLLDDLIGRGQNSQAIQQMLRTAVNLPQFFKHFDQHPSNQVLLFAEKIQPLLMQRPEKKLQSLGKLFSLMIKKGKSSRQVSARALDPLLEPAARALLRSDTAQGAGLLAAALWQKPRLITSDQLTKSRGFINLCRQVEQKLSTIDLDRFKAVPSAGDSASIAIDDN